VLRGVVARRPRALAGALAAALLALLPARLALDGIEQRGPLDGRRVGARADRSDRVHGGPQLRAAAAEAARSVASVRALAASNWASR